MTFSVSVVQHLTLIYRRWQLVALKLKRENKYRSLTYVYTNLKNHNTSCYTKLTAILFAVQSKFCII